MVDPLHDSVDMYIDEADRLGLTIIYVIDTHIHADHISGARALAAKTGGRLVLSSEAPAQFAFDPLDDGGELDMGNVVVRAIHTPGHTPEHICLLVTDRRRAPEPWCLLSGHTLMIGDTGRPDLVAREGASDLHHSIFEKILELPDHIEVFPGAFSGST